MSDPAMGNRALLTVSLGPVQRFIAQARRIADLWTGSHLLSHLSLQGIEALPEGASSLVFPTVDPQAAATGLPNRFVAKVERDEVEEVAARVCQAVDDEWSRILEVTKDELRRHGLAPSEEWMVDNARKAIEVSWSWVDEDAGYAQAAAGGADAFVASRWFRPFEQRAEAGEKCAICGERTALPDGNRARVRSAWKQAEETTQDTPEERLFRYGQTRLCLVCAAKRVYALPQELRLYFRALDRFQPQEDRPYYALVQLDGDHMGRVLGWGPQELGDTDTEEFHRALSRGLSRFASGLGSAQPPNLDTAALGIETVGEHAPQLIYAGGDDVLLVADPRDAMPVAAAIRYRYRKVMTEALDGLLGSARLRKITVSGAILFVHTKQPAGLSLRACARLLNEKAKREADRDAVAVRLDKRGGVPVETAFRWDEGPCEDGPTWLQLLQSLVTDLRSGRLSSGQTFTLREEERLLSQVFATRHWRPWLADRLDRNATTGGDHDLAARIAPFFDCGKSEALRIVRFLGREMDVASSQEEDSAP